MSDSKYKNSTDVYKAISIDGSRMSKLPNEAFDGLGMVSANNSSRLLLDYKAKQRDVYEQLLEYIFSPNYMGLSLLKLEMGADVDSSSGTEPCIKRSLDEMADVTRGAGYQLAADAKKYNKNLKIDMLYWGIPAWVMEARDIKEAMYIWYKETLDAMYHTYGLKADYVTVSQNEKQNDAELIKYISKSLKNEKNAPYDYSQIEIVAGEGVCNWEISEMMIVDEELRNLVDVISVHYYSFTDDNTRLLQKKYGKKVWFSEGSSPMSSQDTFAYDGTGTGLSDMNGLLDIATRLTQAFTDGMTMYEFQPVISSYYDGASYYPKQLITANTPWSGAYSLDEGFYMTLHFAKFIKSGWKFIDGACFGDASTAGDGHCMAGGLFNYITAVAPEKNNMTFIAVNQSDKTINYELKLSELNIGNKPFYVWETRGPQKGETYDSNFFKQIDRVMAENSMLTITIKPYSLVTVSSLKVDVNIGEIPENKVLELPYEDDFSYQEFAEDFLESRGHAPILTTDQAGAFEVANDASLDIDNGQENDRNRNILMQKITYDNKPIDWGYTANPFTTLGDDLWSNYSVSIDAHFAKAKAEKTGDNLNYLGLGLRCNHASNHFSGYWLCLCEDGSGSLKFDERELISFETEIDLELWHNLKVSAEFDYITAYVDDVRVAEYKASDTLKHSGRVSIYSDYQNNYFANLKIENIDGITDKIQRYDNFDRAFSYSEGSSVDTKSGWYFNTMCSFANFGRTIAIGYEGASVSFEFDGTEVALLGTNNGELRIEIDGKCVEETLTQKGGTRNAFYWKCKLEKKKHMLKLIVVSGNVELDAAEVTS